MQSRVITGGQVDYEFKTPPYPHQAEAFEATRDLEAWGIFWEQRCGKTWLALNTAGWQYRKGLINGLLVIAPPGVHLDWVRNQIPTHLPDPIARETKTHCYVSSKASTKYHAAAVKGTVLHNGFAIMAMSYQGFMTDLGKKAAWAFLKKRRAMITVDESHHIKTPGIKTTKSVIAAGKYAVTRRILDGTPVSEGPFDVYSPIRFLDQRFWVRRHTENFAAFKSYYGIWYTRQQAEQDKGYDPGYDKLLGYKNLPELTEHLKTISHRVTQDQVLKLPPKVFSKRYFEMTPKQRALYKKMEDEFEIEIRHGEIITAALAIVRIGRLQQIASGYIPDDSGEPYHLIEPDKVNPRIKLLEEVLAEAPGQAVIFCQYRLDIGLILDALGRENCTRYDGGVSDVEGAENIDAFQAGKFKWIVVTYARGSEGRNLSAARTWVAYSHTQKGMQRSQSEARVIAPEQLESRFFVDLMGQDTCDEKIVNSLRNKRSIAAEITGDAQRDSDSAMSDGEFLTQMAVKDAISMFLGAR